jgi:hypothetical protein
VGVVGERRLALAAVLLGLWTTVGEARVIVTASRADTPYSGDLDPNCADLSARPDANLPLNVVRLRATVPNVAPELVRYQWTLPDPEVGLLVADLPLAAGETTFSLRTMCTEYGNMCQLNKDTLPNYSQPTILWVAPSCDVLPQNTNERFRGGQVTVAVNASVKGRSRGKGRVRLSYGTVGALAMLADGNEGLGGAVSTDGGVVFGASVDPGGFTLPPVSDVEFDLAADKEHEPGAGDPGCRDANGQPFAACTIGEYKTAGPRRVTANAKLVDGSALCDANMIAVRGAENSAALRVEVTPRLASYVPGHPKKGRVRVRVILTDTSAPNGGLRFQGDETTLTCDSKIKIGKLIDSRSTSFAFSHCSGTVTQTCFTDAECMAPQTCLTTPHCEVTTSLACQSDADCSCKVRCGTDQACLDDCEEEKCQHFLAVPFIESRPGLSVELVNTEVDLLNVFPSDAEVVDTWTVTPFNAAPASATVSYRIKKKKNATGRVVR